MEHSAARRSDDCAEVLARLFAALGAAAIPQLDFGSYRAIRVATRFFRPVRNRFVGDSVLRSPRPHCPELSEKVLERSEALAELLAAGQAIPETKEFSEGRDVGHREVEAPANELVFTALAFAPNARVLLGEEFVGRILGLVLDHQFEAGNACGGPGKVGNGAGNLEDDDPIGRQRSGVVSKFQDTLGSAIERVS